MRKGHRFCVLLTLLLCVPVNGCTGAGDTGSGYYQDDSIGDAGLDGIKDRNGKKDAGGEQEITDWAGMWYEQSGRRARIRIRDASLEYDIEGGWKSASWHGGKMSVQEEEDGTYRLSIDRKDSFYPYILYDSKENILVARDNEGTETVFKRTKFVPDADALQKEAEEYPAPNESFCGDWNGYPEDVSGGYSLTLGAPDASGRYQIDASFHWMHGDSGNGMFVDIIDIIAEAVVSDGVMLVSGSYDGGSSKPESERAIKAVLEQHNGGLRFIVLECDAFLVHPGDWFDLVRE